MAKPHRRVKHGSKSAVKQFNTSFELLGVGLQVLRRIEACENSRDISRQLGCSKSNVTYWTKKLLSMEAISLQCRDVFKYFTLTPFGEELLRRSSKVSLGVRDGFVVPVVLEDNGRKYRVVEGEKVRIEWSKLGDPRNWVKLGVRIGGVRVVRTPEHVIVHPGRVKGFHENDLVRLQERIAERVRNVLENRFGMVLRDVGQLHDDIFKFYTEEAPELHAKVGNISVNDKAWIDDSPPRDVREPARPHEEYVGEARARAKRLLLSPDGLIRVESKIDGLTTVVSQLTSELHQVIGDVHLLVQTLREGTPQNGGVPDHISERGAVGVS